jgi:hypothetical protein
MTLLEKQKLFTKNIADLIGFALDNGIGLTFGEVYRTREQQEIYFKSGRSKTMNSRHLKRLAVDFNFFDESDGGRMLFSDNNSEQYKKDIKRILPLAIYWMQIHGDNVWGGDWDRDYDVLDEKFRDPYHFEMRP